MLVGMIEAPIQEARRRPALAPHRFQRHQQARVVARLQQVVQAPGAAGFQRIGDVERRDRIGRCRRAHRRACQRASALGGRGEGGVHHQPRRCGHARRTRHLGLRVAAWQRLGWALCVAHRWGRQAKAESEGGAADAAQAAMPAPNTILQRVHLGRSGVDRAIGQREALEPALGEAAQRAVADVGRARGIAVVHIALGARKRQDQALLTDPAHDACVDDTMGEVFHQRPRAGDGLDAGLAHAGGDGRPAQVGHGGGEGVEAGAVRRIAQGRVPDAHETRGASEPAEGEVLRQA